MNVLLKEQTPPNKLLANSDIKIPTKNSTEDDWSNFYTHLAEYYTQQGDTGKANEVFWQIYSEVFWGADTYNSIKIILPTFKAECNVLGYTPINNKFINFIEYAFKHSLNIFSENYKALHNAAATGVITNQLLSLASDSSEADRAKNILYCPDLYKQTPARILQLLKWQKFILKQQDLSEFAQNLIKEAKVTNWDPEDLVCRALIKQQPETAATKQINDLLKSTTDSLQLQAAKALITNNVILAIPDGVIVEKDNQILAFLQLISKDFKDKDLFLDTESKAELPKELCNKILNLTNTSAKGYVVINALKDLFTGESAKTIQTIANTLKVTSIPVEVLTETSNNIQKIFKNYSISQQTAISLANQIVRHLQ